MAALVQGDQVPDYYENVTQPHVASFDFFLQEGMEQVVDLLPPMEVSAGRKALPASPWAVG